MGFSNKSSGFEERRIGRYCGGTTPGPLITEMGIHRLRIRLHSDHKGVAGGFRATYKFLNDNQLATRTSLSILLSIVVLCQTCQWLMCFSSLSLAVCGHDFVTDELAGVITSPNYPGKYYSASFVCEWNIRVRSKYKIAVVFTVVEIEGEPMCESLFLSFLSFGAVVSVSSSCWEGHPSELQRPQIWRSY